MKRAWSKAWGSFKAFGLSYYYRWGALDQIRLRARAWRLRLSSFLDCSVELSEPKPFLDGPPQACLTTYLRFQPSYRHVIFKYLLRRGEWMLFLEEAGPEQRTGVFTQ